MAEWQNEDLKKEIKSNLEEVRVTKIPKQLYQNQIQPVLKDYKEMLEDINFDVELDEPDKDGRVKGSVKSILKIDSFKLPDEGIGDGRVPSKLEVTVSVVNNNVETRYQIGEEEDKTENALSRFSQENIENIIGNFNTKLMYRTR